MFRFVYAWQDGEPFDTLAADGFVGVESKIDPPPGVALIGTRKGPLTTGTTRLPDTTRLAQGGYTVARGAFRPVDQFGRWLRGLLDADQQRPDVLHLLENGGAFATASELWGLLEAVHHPRVRIAIDADLAHASGQTPAVLVPTLNLRIGLVRVSSPGAETTEYARRLAGVGFEGYVVCDPPAGPDRPSAALALAATFRSVFPAKPAKKSPPAKPTAAKPSKA